MECGVQSAMISVPPTSGGGGDPALTTFAAPDADQAQFEADKRSVYKHPLFPLLALLFERCELATQSSDPQSSDAFNLDIQAFVQHQERDRKPFLANEPEIDGLMIKAIQVLRIHLLELEKVQELCKDFCNRYITCLKGKMQSENLLRSDYPQDVLGAGNLLNTLENNNNMLSHHNSDSGSASTSPIQYSMPQPQPNLIPNDTTSTSYHHPYPTTIIPPPSTTPTPTTTNTNENSLLVVHGSTPLSQIGAPISEVSSGPLSPAPTTPGASDCDDSSDFASARATSTSRNSNPTKQKRGVLPKHATSVMRSWLFQHLVHPYPTEDEKRHIAAQTNLTLLQVNNWFINARRRILQPMLDASSTPNDNGGGGSGGSPTHKKKKNQNNNRRFWPPDFVNMQPQIDSGMLSSSDDEGDLYSSDEERSLVIDAQQNESVNHQNGHPTIDPLVFTNSSPDTSPPEHP